MYRLTLLASLLASTTSHAQEAPRPDAAATEQPGDPILVTGTRAPAPIDAIASSVTVIDKAAIDQSQDMTIADLLARTPGVTLSRNGGLGTATSVRIRGAESDQTVVVIDGVKLNDPTATGGGFDFGQLLTGDASRIEVLRGPQSTIWGSQAIGGVVNIVTPLPEGPLGGSFDVEAGSRDTVSARAAIGGKAGPLSFRLAGQSLTTDGISAIASGTERDGTTNRSATGRAVLDLADGIQADLRGYYSRSRVDFDSSFGDPDTPEFGENQQWIGYAGLNASLFGGRFRNRFAYTLGLTDHDSRNPDIIVGDNKTFDAHGRTRRLEYQGSVAFTSAINATFGIEDERATFRAISPQFQATPDRGRADITSYYGQLNISPLTGLTLTGGLRHDDHNQFGGKTLFSGGAAWSLFGGGTILRGTYSEGFKAPSLYQLYSQYGNTALHPEQAKGFDAGIEQHLLGDRVSLSGTYFERRTTNLIGFNGAGRPDRPFGFYDNTDKAFAQGIEATAAVRIIDGLMANANYSWIATEDRSPGAGDQDLLRRPRHVANGSLTYTASGGFSAGVAARWSGRSFDQRFDDVTFETVRTRLAPYALVDLRAEVPISRQVALFGRVENLFDKEYQTVYNYGTLGRSIYAGFRGRF